MMLRNTKSNDKTRKLVSVPGQSSVFNIPTLNRSIPTLTTHMTLSISPQNHSWYQIISITQLKKKKTKHHLKTLFAPIKGLLATQVIPCAALCTLHSFFKTSFPNNSIMFKKQQIWRNNMSTMQMILSDVGPCPKFVTHHQQNCHQI